MIIDQIITKAVFGAVRRLQKGAKIPAGAARGRPLLIALSPLLLIVAAGGCSRAGPKVWQGYLEGDFVYVSSPLAGRLEKLDVEKGARVAAGAPLFELERAAEIAAERQASQELQAARDQLADLSKGSRPDEIAALEARLGQARAAAELSKLDLARQEKLFKPGADRGERLRPRAPDARGGRPRGRRGAPPSSRRRGSAEGADAIAAAGALVRAAADAEAHSRWSVDQKAQASPCDALVYDTLYREGEFVAAGSPVVSLLPPANIKVRFFVAEPDFALLKAGQRLAVGVTGLASPLEATVSYLSPQPEYTPPVLYNRDNRAKLVFMIEAVFAPGAAADLHPGQPVDVRLAGR